MNENGFAGSINGRSCFIEQKRGGFAGEKPGERQPLFLSAG